MRILRHTAVVCVAAAALLLGIAPAGASPGVFKSVYHAGYFAGPGGITHAVSATATVTLPSIACGQGENSAIDPTVAVYDSNTSANSVASTGVRFECVNGHATYQPQMLINGVRTFPALTVHTGDQIRETVTQNAGGATDQLVDVTTNTTVSRSGAGSTTDNYATVTMESVNTTPTSSIPQPVPNFGKEKFNIVRINGRSLVGLNISEWEMYSGTSDPPAANAHLLIATGAVNSNGAFETYFHRRS